MKSRSQLLKINTISSLIFQVVSLVCGFILPKLIIENYGSSINGLLSSITQFLGFIALCEMGMGAVVPASLYKPLAKRDNIEISKIVASSERFYKRIAFGMLIYIGFLIVFYPILINTYSFVFTTSLIIIIASSSFAQYYFGITYSLLIAADQKQYITYVLNICTIIINLVVSYFLIELGCSIHIVKLLSAIIFLVRPIYYNLYVKSHYQLIYNIQYVEEPIKQKWNGFAQHIAYTIQDKSGILVLSLLSTLETVSVFSIYYMILEGVRGFVYSVTSSLTSFMGNILANGEKDTLNRNFIRIEWILHSITILVFSSAAVLIIPFVRVYTIGVTDADYIVSVFPYIICAAIGCRCLQMPYNIVVQAAGHFKETQNSAIIEPAINIIISIAFVKELGLSGVAIGMLVSILYRMMYLSLYLTRHILFSSKLLLFKRIFVDIVMMSVIILICSLIPEEDTTYFFWILMAIKVVTVASIITILINIIFYHKLTIEFLSNILNRHTI